MRVNSYLCFDLVVLTPSLIRFAASFASPRSIPELLMTASGHALS